MILNVLLTVGINRLEQYGRSSSLRFNNMNTDLRMNETQIVVYENHTFGHLRFIHT